MRNGEPQEDGYAIEWLIEPPLWRDGTNQRFEGEGLAFESDGKRIATKTENSTLSEESFYNRANKFVQRLVTIYRLVKSLHFALGKPQRKILRQGKEISHGISEGCVRVQEPVSIKSKDAEGNQIWDLEVEQQKQAREIIDFGN